MSGVLMKKSGDEVILYVAIPTTDTTHVSTNSKVIYVKVPNGQTLKEIVDAL
jgi:hypothetical protein